MSVSSKALWMVRVIAHRGRSEEGEIPVLDKMLVRIRLE